MMHQATSDDIITSRDLSLGFNQHPILSHVTLTIHKGEFIAILGPNGSGKSTFLRALLGLIKPLSGSLSVLGSVPYRGHVKIGYMPQIRQFATPTHLTSRALITSAFQGTRYGLPFVSAQEKKMVQNVIEMVHAEDLAEKPFQYLSGGEKQRIYLAQALLANPPILLLDEPLAGLDPHFQETFVSLLKQIQIDLNVTILFTAHDPNPLLHAMNRVLYFAKGKALLGTIDDIITSHTLSELYETPIEVIRYKQRLLVLGETHSLEDHHHA